MVGCLGGGGPKPKPIAWGTLGLGDQGSASIAEGKLVFHEAKIRTAQSFQAPVSIDFNILLRKGDLATGALMIHLVPVATTAVQTSEVGIVRLSFGAVSGAETNSGYRLEIHTGQEDSASWTEGPFAMHANVPKHLMWNIYPDGMEVGLNGKVFKVSEIAPPVGPFYIELHAGGEGNEWIVRDLVVR